MFNRIQYLLGAILFKGVIAAAQPVVYPGQPSTGPGSIENYKHKSISIYDCAAHADGYWLYEPADPKPVSAPVVVFMHGYGAYNPMVYGKWIKHLVAQGNIVIYPRYQWNLILPKAEKFPETAAKGIRGAIEEMQTNAAAHVQPDLDKVVYIGHSYGGTINANLGVHWETLGVPKPAAMALVQPGTGPLSGAILEDYSGMPTDVNLLCIVGAQDYIVGDRLARRVYETAIHTPNRNLVIHYPDSSAERTLWATHHEPYCIDYDLDNGVRNYTALRTMRTSRLDEVDFLCYWKLTDALITYTRTGRYGEYVFGNTPQQTFMGTWANGAPIRPLEVFIPGKQPASIPPASEPTVSRAKGGVRHGLLRAN